MATPMMDNTYKIQERILQVPNRLLAGAGPSNSSPRVLRALSEPCLGIMDPQHLKIVDDLKKLVRYVFQTKNEMTLVQQTSGTGGMETIISNLLEPGQRILVAVAGVWGDRAAIIAENFKLDVVRLQVGLGQVYSLQELEEAIIKHKPKVLFVTHGESSHGTLQPLEGLGDICHKHDCLLAVDCIVSLGAVPFFADRWGIDAAVSATQKAFSAPAGMSLLTFSKKAEEYINNRKTPVPFYYDLKGLSTFWGINGAKRYYYYSYNSSMLAATLEALSQVAEEGLEAVWKKHSDIQEYFIKKAAAIGLFPVVQNEKQRLCSVTPLLLPKNINADPFKMANYILEKHNMEIGYGIGPTQNIAIRVGVMGYNARKEVVDFIINALEDACKNLV